MSSQNRNPEINRVVREAFQLKGEFPDTTVLDGVQIVYDVKGVDAATANYVLVSDGSDTLAINTDGSINAIAPENTLTWISAQGTTGAGTTIGTVPANKRWRIVYCQFSQSWDDAATASYDAKLNLNGTPIIRFEAQTVATYSGGGMSESVRFELSACPVLTAGQTITVTAAANEAWACCIAYVQESV